MCVPIEFRKRQNDTWHYGDRDYSDSMCIAGMVTGGFKLGVLQIPYQAIREMFTLRIKNYSVS